ncbi:MAG: phage gp6-like head-tail connector protein [Peptococcaceae bacterium]|nr:phage gp6-like head-tail connector protein [Peptococcaceae bacterium]
MLEAVKLALRISHNKLDGEIQDYIIVAQRELMRLGVSEAMATSEVEPLIVEAVKTYCKYAYATDEKQRDGYFNSWQYQADCLSKTAFYRGG